MNDFFVYLFSQSSQNIFPQNTLANFKTQLNAPLPISRETHRVALSQISYYKSDFILSTKTESDDRKIYFHFKNNDKKIIYTHTENLKNDPLSIEELTSEINSTFKSIETLGFIISIETRAKTLIHIKKGVVSNIPTPRQNTNQIERDAIDKISNILSIVKDAKDIEIIFHNKILGILGFDIGLKFSYLGSIKGSSVSNYSPNKDFGRSLIFVYCDFIENILAGSTSAPILRIIPPNSEPHGSLIYHNFINPFFLELSREFIQVPHIFLLNENGNEVVLDRGMVNLTLHFKVKKL